MVEKRDALPVARAYLNAAYGVIIQTTDNRPWTTDDLQFVKPAFHTAGDFVDERGAVAVAVEGYPGQHSFVRVGQKRGGAHDLGLQPVEGQPYTRSKLGIGHFFDQPAGQPGDTSTSRGTYWSSGKVSEV